jgi:hypothetical protein
MTFSIEDFCFDQQLPDWLRQLFHHRIGVLAQVRMMDKPLAANLQFLAQLANVGFDNFAPRVNQRIEAEHEVDRIIREHRERTAVIDVLAEPGIPGETPATRFNTFFHPIDNPQSFAVVF